MASLLPFGSLVRLRLKLMSLQFVRIFWERKVCVKPELYLHCDDSKKGRGCGPKGL